MVNWLKSTTRLPCRVGRGSAGGTGEKTRHAESDVEAMQIFSISTVECWHVCMRQYGECFSNMIQFSSCVVVCVPCTCLRGYLYKGNLSIYLSLYIYMCMCVFIQVFVSSFKELNSFVSVCECPCLRVCIYLLFEGPQQLREKLQLPRVQQQVRAEPELPQRGELQAEPVQLKVWHHLHVLLHQGRVRVPVGQLLRGEPTQHVSRQRSQQRRRELLNKTTDTGYAVKYMPHMLNADLYENSALSGFTNYSNLDNCLVKLPHYITDAGTEDQTNQATQDLRTWRYLPLHRYFDLAWIDALNN